jgi:RimJ/RimL family protein N-acetyltransferase
MTVISVAPAPATSRVDHQILRALTAWLGVWPESGMLRVAPSARRILPGWDGVLRPLAGVAAGSDLGHAVALSVPPRRFAAVTALVDELAARSALRDRRELGARLPGALGVRERRYAEPVLRWSLRPALLPRIGSWLPSDDPGLPDWLRPFGGNVLVSLDHRGRFLAGVGIKRHNRLVHEIAGGTAEHARGRGLARALVAQAAARILDAGALPLYLHDPNNVASAHVAEAAGFADRGWRFLALEDT